MALFNSNKNRLRRAFGKVRDEFDEHLDAINSNTEEILENRAMILELEERMCKLGDKISELSMRLGDTDLSQHMFEPIELSLREQEVFIVLYTSESPLQYSLLARQLSLPVSLVQELIYGLIQKGVPVVKQRRDGVVFLSMDIEFKEHQSKQNLVSIDNSVLIQLNRELQTSLID